ncbi:SigB/SigF/SigG family RNA polymerase sigma factor [Nocardia jinanensis]|uniref:RNA polymerase sigma factor SigF n=1 Tax=Nocardia jinanensis TaxID=382504 RepID=A0A917VRF3_9NOCA|nr:SigB/SigF/SigG family RNA polymerase sigma factor [Nocardia jinanensis]GGL10377.1 RNA polymerase sigma factor SigF [Nocardia jinanensis]
MTAHSSSIRPAPSPSARRADRGRDTYDGIEPLLGELAALDPADPHHAELRDEIIGRCLPLADHIARRYAGRGIDFDDLQQTARMGVVHAVDRFDPAAGTKFVSFAVPTAMGEVRRYFRDQSWAIRVPRRLKELRGRITATTPLLMQELGHTPNARDLATALDTDVEEITQALIASKGYTSEPLDAAPGAEDDSGDLALSHADRLGSIDPCYGLLEDAAAVRPLLAQLPRDDRRVLILRYFENKTQREIGATIGCSQMQASRILTRILATLREQALGEPAAGRAA